MNIGQIVSTTWGTKGRILHISTFTIQIDFGDWIDSIPRHHIVGGIR